MSAREQALDALGHRRQQIEAMDRRIGAMRKLAGLPTLDPAREAEVIRGAAGMARENGLNDEKVRDIFWHVIGLSRAVQVDE